MASGTAITAAGCLGNENDEDENDGTGDDGTDEEMDDSPADDGVDQDEDETDSLDEPVDVVLETNYGSGFEIEVEVTRDGESAFDDTVQVDAETTERFEDVVDEPGEYTVEATKAGDLTATRELTVTENTTDVYVRVSEDGEFTVDSDE